MHGNKTTKKQNAFFSPLPALFNVNLVDRKYRRQNSNRLTVIEKLYMSKFITNTYHNRNTAAKTAALQYLRICHHSILYDIVIYIYIHWCCTDECSFILYETELYAINQTRNRATLFLLYIYIYIYCTKKYVVNQSYFSCISFLLPLSKFL